VEFLRVAEAMSENIVIVDEGVSVAEAALNMYNKKEGYAIVLRQGKPFGIVTDRDVTWKVAGRGLDPKTVKVSEIMSAPLITVDADADLSEAAKLMKKHKIWRVAVMKDNNLQGVLTAGNIASNLERYVDREMRDILGYLVAPRYLPEQG
jgi:CBS domain-containing protein